VSVVCIVLAGGQQLWSLCSVDITLDRPGGSGGGRAGSVAVVSGAMTSYMVLVARAGCFPGRKKQSRKRAARSSSGFALLSTESLGVAMTLSKSSSTAAWGRGSLRLPLEQEVRWTWFSQGWVLPRWFTR
jgi:hypothetical protein